VTADATSSPEDPAAAQLKEILDQLRGLDTGSPGLAAQVLEVFLQDTSNQLTVLREGIGRRHFKVIHEAAHSMQGSASMVGAASLATLCRQVAEAARAESFDRCEILAAELTAAFEALRRAAARD
jgi:HPt (histidine-containing phosphotransfer) domain-containing protein